VSSAGTIGAAGGAISGVVSSTSTMRSAHTAARGIMIDMNVVIITATRIIIRYDRYAVSAPIASSCSLIAWLPNHITATLDALNTSMTVGHIAAWSLPMRNAIPVRSLFASSKRSASAGSRTNARTTRMPVICSRSTRLTVSILGCISRNLGIIRLMMKPMLPARTGMHTSNRRDSARSSRTAITMPPTHMIGAITIIVMLMRTRIWTCWTSFVVRVISDGAPTLPTSRADSLPT
jgi:hypothetical protein